MSDLNGRLAYQLSKSRNTERFRRPKRRADIARAHYTVQTLLFLDETNDRFDIQTRSLIWDLPINCRGRGMTVVLTTHYLDEADEAIRFISWTMGK